MVPKCPKYAVNPLSNDGFLGDVEFFSEALLSAEMFHDVSIIDQDTPQNIILVYINMIRI